jgi:chromosomal replication initiation ATPase DnaA
VGGLTPRRAAGQQLPLAFPADPGFGEEDFLISASNESVCAMIDLWPHWPDRTLLIKGPRGAGKSHLGAIWAAKAKARIYPAKSLRTMSVDAIAAAGPLLLEDLEEVEGETQLFHLINLMRESDATLVLTARTAPDDWGLKTPDLLSRLRLAPSIEIGAPDDALMRAVLVKLCIDRQLLIDASLIEFAALRLERSLNAARSFAEALDREALARKSKISRALVSVVIETLTLAEPSDGEVGRGNEILNVDQGPT